MDKYKKLFFILFFSALIIGLIAKQAFGDDVTPRFDRVFEHEAITKGEYIDVPMTIVFLDVLEKYKRMVVINNAKNGNKDLKYIPYDEAKHLKEFLKMVRSYLSMLSDTYINHQVDRETGCVTVESYTKTFLLCRGSK